jgi:hypothetical protein
MLPTLTSWAKLIWCKFLFQICGLKVSLRGILYSPQWPVNFSFKNKVTKNWDVQLIHDKVGNHLQFICDEDSNTNQPKHQINFQNFLFLLPIARVCIVGLDVNLFKCIYILLNMSTKGIYLWNFMNSKNLKTSKRHTTFKIRLVVKNMFASGMEKKNSCVFKY